MGRRLLEVKPGDKYGRWTIIEDLGMRKIGTQNVRFLRCVCDCGAERKIRLSELRRKKSQSCGCYHLDVLTKHGDTANKLKPRLYVLWASMRARCNDPHRPNYKYYGGRGITVCNEWDNYVSFRDWALNNGYKIGLTIDRVDNDRGYSPENCRFVDQKTQCQNRRKYYQKSGQ